MLEILQEVTSQARSAWRFRWLGAAVAWTIAAAGWVGVAALEDVYEASARILVDTSSVLTPLLRGQVVESDPTTRLVQARQTLLSRANLEKVVRGNGLDATAETDADRERVLARLASTIVISTTPASQSAGINARDSGFVFSISYRHTDRRTAVGVVTSFKDILVEEVLVSNRERSQLAGSYLEREIALNNELLEQAEQERLDFLREHSDRLPNSGGGIQGRIQREEEALQEVLRQRRLAESSRAQLLDQLQNQSPVAPGNAAGTREPAPGSIDAQIRDARAELNRLLVRYLDAHPAVQDARAVLESLEERRAEQLRGLGISNPDQELSNLEANAVYEETMIELNKIEREIAVLGTDIQDRERQIANLRSQIEDVLAVETRLEGLDRAVEKYNDVRLTLEEARQRQQRTADVSEADQLDFLVTDPPRAGTDPVAPQRLILIAAAFAAGLGIAAGLCWLLAQIKSVFTTERALREITGIPVLGTVSRATISRRAKIGQRLNVVAFAGTMMCLMLALCGAVLIELAGPGARSLLGMA